MKNPIPVVPNIENTKCYSNLGTESCMVSQRLGLTLATYSGAGQNVACKHRPVNEETDEDLFMFDCQSLPRTWSRSNRNENRLCDLARNVFRGNRRLTGDAKSWQVAAVQCGGDSL
jgi:hypothetical protein